MGSQTWDTATSTTFDVTSAMTQVVAECWGAGGAGGGGPGTSGGSGGGGGGYSKKTYDVPGELAVGTYDVVVGAKGTGVSDGKGGDGGDTYFVANNDCMAKGGTGGAVNGGTVGAGGASGSGYGDTKWSGGSGCAGATNGGRGGGTSAGTGANGTTATGIGPTSGPAGSGPGGTGSNSTHGIAPASGPGGGGGGGNDDTPITGGDGWDGKLILTWTLATVTGTGALTAVDPSLAGEGTVTEPSATTSFDPFGLLGFYGM